MRVSDYILARLADEGIDTAFMVYGGAIAELIDAFPRQSRIRYVCPQHEQAAGFMAEGYAKAKGVPGLAIATSGPGGGNMVTAIQNCYYDSTPCVFITGQVSTKFMRPSQSRLRQLGFQETPIVDIVAPITKLAHTLRYPHLVGEAMDLLLDACRSKRPGPVLLDLPIDVQRAEIDPVAIPRQQGIVHPYPLCTEAAQGFLADLAQAHRPGILVGGGARGARKEIVAFASTHNIPVFRTWNAFDVVTDDSPIYGGTVGTYGGPGRNFGLQNCDLLLVLGCRLSGRITGGMPESFARSAKLYWVDVDPGLLDPAYQPRKADRNVLCDAREFVKVLESSLVICQHRYAWLSRCRDWIAKYDPVRPEDLNGGLHHYGFLRRLSELLPANAIVVNDTGGNTIMMGHCFRSKAGQRIFSSNGNTPMGFALCGAIGACFAEPSRPVYCIIGDGGMQLNIQELQTLVHYGAKVKVFILNNHILGNTKSYQRVNKVAELGCGPDGYSAPDFLKIAQAYGIPAWYMDETWREELPALVGAEGPFICDVEHDDFCTYEPRMSRWDTPIEEMYPYLPREEFRANLIIEPWKGWEEIK